MATVLTSVYCVIYFLQSPLVFGYTQGLNSRVRYDSGAVSDWAGWVLATDKRTDAFWDIFIT